MGRRLDIEPLDPIIVESKNLTGTILIVDDNEDIVEITKATLEQFTRFKILTASNGRKALDILSQGAIDVIVLDDHMPEMSGPEFFRIIRQRSIYVPVIFLTGMPDDKSRRQQMSLGAFDYLEKPVRARDLIQLVNEASKVMDRIRAILERRD